MPHEIGVLAALKDWGLTVVEVPGWRTRGSSAFDPAGHVIHHDVIGPKTSVPDLIITGRSDLPGPLCNFWLERNGRVHLVAAGKANHAGEGGWNGLSGNASVWGTEMNNLGVPSDPWPALQLDAMARLAAATSDYSGSPIANVCGHKEWAPDRKIDPHSINMTAFRAEVLAEAKGGLMPDDVERLMDKLDAIDEKVPGVKQQERDRNRVKAIGKAIRAIKEGRPIDDEILAAIEED